MTVSAIDLAYRQCLPAVYSMRDPLVPNYSFQLP